MFSGIFHICGPLYVIFLGANLSVARSFFRRYLSSCLSFLTIGGDIPLTDLYISLAGCSIFFLCLLFSFDISKIS